MVSVGALWAVYLNGIVDGSEKEEGGGGNHRDRMSHILINRLNLSLQNTKEYANLLRRRLIHEKNFTGKLNPSPRRRKVGLD